MGAATDTVTLTAPDGGLEVKLYSTDDGRLSYDARRLKPAPTQVLERSPLGIVVDGVDLGQNAELAKVQRSPVDEPFPWRGGHSTASNHCERAVLYFTCGATRTLLLVEFRVFNDGLAYRYIVPGTGQRTLQGEASAWTLPEGCKIWHQPNTQNYEGIYSRNAPGELKSDVFMGFPVTIEYPDGTYGALTEAGLFDYSGMTLRGTGSNRIDGVFQDDSSWKATGEIRSPWRVTLVTADLNSLVNSDIVPALCPPPDPRLFPEGMHTDWIRPGRSLWNWWSDSSVEFRFQKEWVDHAAEMGMDYYLVDAGWEESWNRPDKDKWACLKELCDYAKGKGIGINVWKHWEGLQQPDLRRDFLHRCAQAGATGVKIDFMDSESRSRIQFYTDTLIDTAKEKLLVNFHGANKPTGESRTYPNELTREGIRGLEYNKWDRLPPAHYATLPFTRYLAGPGDFTPCTFNPDRLHGTTAALQLASAIVFTSPLLHWADTWNRYQDSGALEVIRQVPSTWDETRVLPGSRIGEIAAFARRKGNVWFVAVVNGGGARHLSITTDFLPGAEFRATEVRDAAGKPAALDLSHTTIQGGGTVDTALEAGGGFVAVLSPGSGSAAR